ncbi:MAG: 2-oxoglutarate dehydrogenase, E2 component, dihydrolipoamide succinyltransferase [Nesterenkonia sp.]|uniref:2-oxoglutarate dehydrogenase, E2 component, dihydrolipoamide succinyltransferase n=1 Tax=Nesterenkonia marinintestina TaxID=2979865 RepID=UPI0021C0A691|nr:2-oxoglutarate dehydrogenase, E2 component, dihydrolipoamide succinyltransferase [Nesterenkonia sp. GX14115]MDO5492460.1 2-oxoglutarate dehydrogenase, E2 component, dihydrolipoamide succinyltransferase [Nesterenkonia sp.]
MSETVNLPALGESVTEGTVTRWLVEVGDEVEVDQPIVEVSTDKVDTEVPSPAAGTVEELLADEDETVEVGSPLIRIGDGSGGSEDSDDDESADEGAEDADEPAEDAEESTEDSDDEAAEDDSPSDDDESDESDDSDSSDGGGDGEDVTLPALGESVTEGTVTRWLVEVGDEVEVDQPILEVSTDKVDTEVPSPVAGTVQELLVDEDETVEVGAVLARVGSGGGSSSGGGAKETPEASDQEEADSDHDEEVKDQAEQPSEADEDTSDDESDDASAEKSEETSEDASDQSSSEGSEEEKKSESTSGSKAESDSKTDSGEGSASAESYVTPLVRQLAKKEGVDLSQLRGTGVGGRIRKQDVLEAAEKSGGAQEETASSGSESRRAPEVEEDTTRRGTQEKAPRIRQVIAQRMKESLDVSAQLTQVQEVDMTRIVQLRGRAKESFQQQNGVKLTYLPFIATAVAEALKQHPKLNAEYDEDAQQITYHDREHLAIAVDTERGLLVPVIQDAGGLNLGGMAQKISDVAERTRSNKIGPNELSGGTFSITNIGSVGALFDTPIINQPQVAILGTGAIVKRPMVVTDAEGNDTIGIRHMMYLSLTYDHRLVDGADAGRFLQTLKGRLEGAAYEGDLGL